MGYFLEKKSPQKHFGAMVQHQPRGQSRLQGLSLGACGDHNTGTRRHLLKSPTSRQTKVLFHTVYD